MHLAVAFLVLILLTAWDSKIELQFLFGSVVSSVFFLEFSGVLSSLFSQKSLQVKLRFFSLHSSEVSESKEDCQSQIWVLRLSVSSFDHRSVNFTMLQTLGYIIVSYFRKP